MENESQLEREILECLNEYVDSGWNIIGMLGTFTNVSFDELAAALRDLLGKGRIRYYGGDDLESNGMWTAFLPAESDWVGGS